MKVVFYSFPTTTCGAGFPGVLAPRRPLRSRSVSSGQSVRGPGSSPWICCTDSPPAELAETGPERTGSAGLPAGGGRGPPAPHAWVRTAPSGRCVALLRLSGKNSVRMATGKAPVKTT